MKGWRLVTETPRVEVTRDGTQPGGEVDIVRRYVAGPMTARLEGPEGQVIKLTDEQINFIWGADQEVVNRMLTAIIKEAT